MADEINTIDVFRDSIDVYELSTEAVQVIEQGPQGPPGDGTLGYYGAFSDYTSQTITSITAAYAMTLNTTDESNGVSRGTPTSKIEFTNAATYNVQWSGQFQNTNNSDHDVRVWLKKNGTDIVGSTGFASIPSSHGQVNGHTIIGWNYILTLAAGDYLQFYWSADSTAVSIQTYSVGSNPTTPSTASLIVTAQQVMNLQVGPTGPQGPAGTAGGISSVALAGTGLSVSGSPVTTSGTITANVAYGTTAGTSTEGNDARIANIGGGTINTSADYGSAGVINTSDNGGGNTGGEIDTSASDYNGGKIQTYGGSDAVGGSISTYDGGGSINTRGTGSIELGVTGTRTTLNGSASGSNKTVTLPNATGTVALTQQATDIEITDPTKGYILNSATKRWRITIDDNGVLLRTALTLLFSLFFMCGAKAQVRDLVYGTNNVVIGPTNTVSLSFTNTVAFSNALTLPQATGLSSTTANGIQWRSMYPSSNGLIALSGTSDQGQTTFRISTGTMSGTTEEIALFNASAVTFYKGLAFNNTTNAAVTRTNLGVTVASNLPAPYSGAATTNSLLTADGAGGSSFVASKTVARILTNDYSKTNWANTTFSAVTNAEAAFGTWSLDANSTYKMEWSVGYTYSTNVVGPVHGVVFSGNIYLQTNSAVGWASVPAGGGIVQITPSTLQVADLSAGTNATGTRFRTGTIFVPTGTNAITAQFHWCPNSSNSNTLTLIKGSTVSFIKIAP